MEVLEAVADVLKQKNQSDPSAKGELITSLLKIADALSGDPAAAAAAQQQQQAEAEASAQYAQGGQVAGGPGPGEISQAELARLAQRVRKFAQQYPVDDRAYDYLIQSEPHVVARVLNEFRPAREGDRDYSAVLTSFIKRIRAQSSGYDAMGGHPARSSTARPGVPGRSLADMPIELQELLMRYPVDERAMEFIASAPEAVQMRVAKEFRPHHEGQADYSALLTSFVKKCMDVTPGAMGGFITDTNPGNIIRNSAHLSQDLLEFYEGGRPMPAEYEVAVEAPGIRDWLAQYPIDARAWEFFINSSPLVQAKVLAEFQPPTQGETNYAGLFTSFVRKCRTIIGSMGGNPNAGMEISFGPYGQGGKGGFVPGGSQGPGVPAEEAGPPPDLEVFRIQYPMDDRAYEFLATSPVEVQRRVVETFKPRLPADNDYSAPLTGYVRSLRRQMEEGQYAMGGGMGGQYAMGGGMGSMGPAVTEEAVQLFFQKYPCDARAVEYFTNLDMQTQAQVMREFAPWKGLNDADFSAPLTAFIKKCKFGGAGPYGYKGGMAPQWEPSYKRPRYQY
mmetsp:Transcript_32096/g.75342  ORF Transcript_32096/g.75342 Transcript_32096/m.75342 type:complete len:561 (+) Transcript_32096:42-1724(+)|eukprot:CAMPEP_0178436098 /NCGR_PEP_ID=MMETSP0689_2-20121128/34266_1 /TAXON_ID=160604 /ORGANISM="Amphidinium massartii, Strain CS-259" /LENGTH=560 /DNA_ID=CAMNT_0020058187 /DNA_START=39 /DNA_END=1721 /DNA_ORIENTATION=+